MWEASDTRTLFWGGVFCFVFGLWTSNPIGIFGGLALAIFAIVRPYSDDPEEF